MLIIGVTPIPPAISTSMSADALSAVKAP